MGCIFEKMFRYQIDKLAELNNIIIGCVLNILELEVKEANMICWYVLQKYCITAFKPFLLFITD